MVLLVDVESRSRAKLKAVGGRRYWDHPETEMVCDVIYSTETRTFETWTPGDPRPSLLDRDEPIAAHNANAFDRFPFMKYFDRDIGIDTSALARTAGLPGALDALATRWLGLEKDKEASRFTKSLSLPSRRKVDFGTLPEITPEKLDRVLGYCATDVDILIHGWPLLEAWLDLEPDVVAADRIVNDRGVQFDSELARVLLAHDARNSERVAASVAREFGETPERIREIAGSSSQFCEYSGLPNAQKKTVADALADPHTPRQTRALCEVRQAIASIARGKLQAGLRRVSDDGRLRDTHKYYGAHTGRWSGVGMQLQNMPRPHDRYESWTSAELDGFAEAVVYAGARAPALTRDEIDLLLRACITAAPGKTLAVCDFSGVEARALAWAAGDTRALDVFASGRDPYRVMASTIFGDPYDAIGKGEKRSIGKIAELACGYGMGPAKFEAQARGAGQDLEAQGVSAAAVVKAWRTQHAPIVQFWKDLELAFFDALEGRETQVSCFRFAPAYDGTDAIACILPSGRPVVYNEPRVGMGKYGPSVSYLGTIARKHVYGGLIVENAIQAMCRDLLSGAMVRAIDRGLDVVMHVHDELVCECDERDGEKTYGQLRACMLELPEWAPGFPIGASGFHGKRYRK